MLIAAHMPGDANACFNRVHAAGIDVLLGGLSETAFPLRPCTMPCEFSKVRARRYVHQVALAWKRTALKLREVEQAGRVIISRFAIWMLISCITKILIDKKINFEIRDKATSRNDR